MKQEDFVKICSEIHENKYEYLLDLGNIRCLDYIKMKNKSNGLIYIQLSKNHRMGITPNKIESNSLVWKLKSIHGDKWDYIVDREGFYTTDEMKMINKYSGDIVEYRVDRHLSGMSPNKITLNYFLKKSNEKHNNKWDYSKISEIKGGSDRVLIGCKDHGYFTQTVSNHMNLGDGCPKCVGRGRWNKELLISEFQKIHFGKWDYSELDFNIVSNKIKIICKEHGPFYQSIYKHLSGQGCKLCKMKSTGEEIIKSNLDKLNIKYIREYGFDSCKRINKLNFDFWLPDMNTCVEFDGIQHYKPVKLFGGDKSLSDTRERDNCKNEWCKKSGIKLIRIRYDEITNIYQILKNNLQQ